LGTGGKIVELSHPQIKGKPVFKDVLHIVIKLAGFDRGAVFLAGKNNELKQADSLGIRIDRKVVEGLVRRSGATASLQSYLKNISGLLLLP
jgi:hypothetical protein